MYFYLNKPTTLNNISESVVYVEAACDDVNRGGTGFVYKTKDDLNYIITSYHIIENCDDIYVYNTANKNLKAKIINYDEYSDIAIIVINDDLNLKNINIGDSDNLNIGDTIYAVGNPININYISTVTHGIISYLNREIQLSTTNGSSILKVIQFDAAMSEGNSGGPLLDKFGNVIGLIFLKESDLSGVGFAIPINYVMEIVDKLEKNELIRPNLGAVITSTTNEDLLLKNDIHIDDIPGLVLVQVYENGILFNSGLQVGDIITNINDEPVYSVSQFQKKLYSYSIGTTIDLEYYRNGSYYTVNIKL